MLEDELTLAGDCGSDLREHELAVLQSPEEVVESLALAVQQRLDRPFPEHAADYGSRPEGASLLGWQEVDAGRQHALDRVRDDDLFDFVGRPPPVGYADDASFVDQVANDLLEEERVALGPLEHGLANRAGELLDGEQELDEPGGIVVRERLEEDRREVALAAAPGRVPLRELGPRRAQEEQRPGGSVRKLLEQVEQGVVGPVDVLDHRDRRALRSETREESPPRLVRLQTDLARRQLGEAEVRVF